jgi:hypothetical protein
MGNLFSETLKKIRMEKGLSQTQLGKLRYPFSFGTSGGEAL